MLSWQIWMAFREYFLLELYIFFRASIFRLDFSVTNTLVDMLRIGALKYTQCLFLDLVGRYAESSTDFSIIFN